MLDDIVMQMRKTNREEGYSQAPQSQCEHGRQKYQDLYGNPDKKLKKIIIWKKSQLKSLNVLLLWIASFLCGYVPYPTRFEPYIHEFWWESLCKFVIPG